jgi:hypothetical protein
MEKDELLNFKHRQRKPKMHGNRKKKAVSTETDSNILFFSMSLAEYPDGNTKKYTYDSVLACVKQHQFEKFPDLSTNLIWVPKSMIKFKSQN